jgi:uncharacterized iron-regulated protein
MHIRLPVILFIALSVGLIFQGCASVKKSIPNLATIPGTSKPYRIGQIIDLSEGEVIPFEKLIEKIAPIELVFVGEVHDNPEHHLIEVQILEALMAVDRHVTIAMEFFQKPEQPILDRYLQGEIDEEEFLKAIDWNEEWGFDYSYYRPLMLLAKQNGSKVLAINAPSAIVRKVAYDGLQSLDPSERDQIAKEIDLNNEAHREYLREIYGEHGHGALKNFEYFYEAQCVWEDTMAQNIADYLIRHQGKMIVFTGNGHIVNKFGIPDRVINRKPVSMATVMPYALQGTEKIKKGMADYVWLTPSYPHRLISSF